MKNYKLTIKKLVLGFAMLTIISILIPQPVSANFTLEVLNNNDMSNTLEVAVRYYIVNKDVWVTRGWYQVPPGETRRFAIGVNDNEEIDTNLVYCYAQRGKKEWWSIKDGQGDMFIPGIVTTQAFAYYDGQEYGKGRKVMFGNMEMENGYYSVRFH